MDAVKNGKPLSNRTETKLDRLMSLIEDDILEGKTRRRFIESDDEVILDYVRFSWRAWAEETDHVAGLAYLLGLKHSEAEISANNVRRAANGRRLIGATSRAKVAKSAQAFKHLSKEKAAIEIADKVQLDPGTVRRYLSELFPGDKWKL